MSLEDTTSDGRMWAVLSYASTFMGLPLGIVPLAQRQDEFAIFHARHAVAMQITFLATYMAVFMVGMCAFFCTFGMSNFVLIPLLMLMMIWPFGVAIHGIILAINGEWKEPFGVFGLGERFLGGITVEKQPEPAEPAAEAEAQPVEEAPASEQPPAPPSTEEPQA